MLDSLQVADGRSESLAVMDEGTGPLEARLRSRDALLAHQQAAPIIMMTADHDVDNGVSGGGGQGGDVGNSSGSGDCRQPYIERP